MLDFYDIKDPNAKSFVDHVINACAEHGVKFIAERDDEHSECRGSFGDYDKELKIFLVPDIWLDVLVHEYSHMEQWLERSPIFLAKYRRRMDPTSVVDNWLNGHDYADSTLDACFRMVKELELDCEKRAVENIKKWNLPINVKRYTKCAIAYIHYYDYTREYRNRCSNVPYENENVIKSIKADFSTMNLDVHNRKIVQLIHENANSN